MSRVEPPYAADERTMLISFLDYNRETMLLKAEGLTPEQLRWTPRDTSNSLLGLIAHIAFVEDWWFREAFLGEPQATPPWDAPDGRLGFHVPDDLTFETAEKMYRTNWAQSNEITLAAPSLDEVVKHERLRERRGEITLRWILVHMVEETARHAGHADISREMIDGQTGD